MSVDTPENYIESMQPPLEGTFPATLEEYETNEKSWCWIMNFDDRTTHNYLTVIYEIPPLYGVSGKITKVFHQETQKKNHHKDQYTAQS